MDAGAAGGLYRDLRSAGADPVPFQRHVYRPAHGCELGRVGRSFSGSLPLRPVLEADYESSLLGELFVLHGGDAGEHLFPVELSGAFAVAHQCRRLLYAGWTCDRAGGECGDESACWKKVGGDLFLL